MYIHTYIYIHNTIFNLKLNFFIYRKRSFSSSSSESINDEISKTSNKKQKQNLHYTILDITDSVFEPENLEHTNKINDFQSHTNTIDVRCKF